MYPWSWRHQSFQYDGQFNWKISKGNLGTIEDKTHLQIVFAQLWALRMYFSHFKNDFFMKEICMSEKMSCVCADLDLTSPEENIHHHPKPTNKDVLIKVFKPS